MQQLLYLIENDGLCMFNYWEGLLTDERNLSGTRFYNIRFVSFIYYNLIIFLVDMKILISDFLSRTSSRKINEDSVLGDRISSTNLD